MKTINCINRVKRSRAKLYLAVTLLVFSILTPASFAGGDKPKPLDTWKVKNIKTGQEETAFIKDHLGHFIDNMEGKINLFTSSGQLIGHATYMIYDTNNNLPYMHIQFMENTDPATYKNVGTGLHAAVINRSLREKSEGRIELEAAYSSHAFHIKAGYKPSWPYRLENDGWQGILTPKFSRFSKKLPQTEEEKASHDRYKEHSEELKKLANFHWKNTGLSL